jgi:hypothetical protein
MIYMTGNRVVTGLQPCCTCISVSAVRGAGLSQVCAVLATRQLHQCTHPVDTVNTWGSLQPCCGTAAPPAKTPAGVQVCRHGSARAVAGTCNSQAAPGSCYTSVHSANSVSAPRLSSTFENSDLQGAERPTRTNRAASSPVVSHESYFSSTQSSRPVVSPSKARTTTNEGTGARAALLLLRASPCPAVTPCVAAHLIPSNAYCRRCPLPSQTCLQR